MTYKEAVEYFEFNILGSYMGEKTPIFLTLFDVKSVDPIEPL